MFLPLLFYRPLSRAATILLWGAATYKSPCRKRGPSDLEYILEEAVPLTLTPQPTRASMNGLCPLHLAHQRSARMAPRRLHQRQRMPGGRGLGRVRPASAKAFVLGI
eukprot:scaffold90472_cov39-Phaeocystis_antarctica.AAC.1